MASLGYRNFCRFLSYALYKIWKKHSQLSVFQTGSRRWKTFADMKQVNSTKSQQWNGRTINVEINSNFIRLLHLRLRDVENLNSWLNRKSRIKWTGHDIQNEILQIMGREVLNAVLKEVKASSHFAIIADETTDNQGNNKYPFVCDGSNQILSFTKNAFDCMKWRQMQIRKHWLRFCIFVSCFGSLWIEAEKSTRSTLWRSGCNGRIHIRSKNANIWNGEQSNIHPLYYAFSEPRCTRFC